MWFNQPQFCCEKRGSAFYSLDVQQSCAFNLFCKHGYLSQTVLDISIDNLDARSDRITANNCSLISELAQWVQLFPFITHPLVAFIEAG